MNRVVLLGRLGADPELRITQGGKAVLKFSLATSEKWTDAKGEKQEKTEWHRCVMWGDRAEALAKYLEKGQQILVEGKIQYGSYEKDNVKHYTTDINVLNVEFAGGNRKSDDQEDEKPAAKKQEKKSNGKKSSAPPPADDFGDYAGGDDDTPF